MSEPFWNIWIDTGGTFTDCIAQNPEGDTKFTKVLSNSSLRGTISDVFSPEKVRIVHSWQAPDNFVKGLGFRVFGDNSVTKIESFDAETSEITFVNSYSGISLSAGHSFEILSDEEAPILACRLATGTLPNDPLPPTRLRLATTKGTNAILEESGAPTLLLITEGFGDFLRIGDQKRPDLFSLKIDKPKPLYDQVIEIPERLDGDGKVLKKLDSSILPESLAEFMKKENGSFAISLMHSYKNDEHEKELEQWLRRQGASFVSSSSDMSPLIKLLPRAQTTVVNAYLDPVLQDYLSSVKNALNNSSVFVMNSAAGLSSSDEFKPKDSLLSGPAGGVIGAAAVGKANNMQKIISLDMGGTSTDVARYDHGFDYQFNHSVGSATINAPALAIETVAAGGGSICSFDGQKLTVGPDSAGADPGPACYGAGGPLTLTDVNLLLGRLQQQNFNIPISIESAEKQFRALLAQLSEKGRPRDPQKVLLGLLQIANERMAEAINKISLRKGYDPSEYALVAFGGAGAQHATAIASLLDMKKVLIPDKAGLLSARGLGDASVEAFVEQQVLESLDKVKSRLTTLLQDLENKARQKLQSRLNNFHATGKIKRRILFLRLEGQESTLELEYQNIETLRDNFKAAYQHRYGHWIEDRDIEVESIRVISAAENNQSIKEDLAQSQDNPSVAYKTQAQFGSDSDNETPVYHRNDLKVNHQLTGPAIILDPYSTTVAEPGWNVRVGKKGTLQLSQKQRSGTEKATDLAESVSLELFTNRFTSIAEEMGEMMRRTALSVNVKERMDFSCALLNSKGELIVNAPHIPVHLGALGLCVRRLKESIEMSPGDVVATNHPRYGGSHLPDITVVTPIYDDDDQRLGYAACRAHHSEIGGTRPGSMPPDASSLAEEGVIILPIHLIKNGRPQWERVKAILTEAPYPSRAVEENIADLQAAVAANHQGAQALHKLAVTEGSDIVRHYMSKIKTQATQRASEMIVSLPEISHKSEEFLDDDTRLCANIQKQNNKLTIDFSGTANVHPGNLNATPAIVESVVIYVLRCLIGQSIPLNEGLLEPVDILLPKGMLNPDFGTDPKDCPAVVGGNTETSQRLVDLLLKPFNRIACSQGTMNNVIFGNESFGYYETIGGGTGAGSDFDGSDAVHHHMTNTAGTDPEILEHRYPVILNCYEIRKGSGGRGKYTGGDGITRKFRFTEPVSLSVLTQHRRQQPYGLQDGQPGKTGEQVIIRSNGEKESLDAIDGAELEAGDQFIIDTPGGGGFGTLEC